MIDFLQLFQENFHMNLPQAIFQSLVWRENWSLSLLSWICSHSVTCSICLSTYLYSSSPTPCQQRNFPWIASRTIMGSLKCSISSLGPLLPVLWEWNFRCNVCWNTINFPIQIRTAGYPCWELPCGLENGIFPSRLAHTFFCLHFGKQKHGKWIHFSRNQVAVLVLRVEVICLE